jgi:phosphatidylglycerol---prolipoprotein diacylglyceryl transferase
VHPVLVTFGRHVSIHSYGVLVTLGFLLGSWIGARDWQRSRGNRATFFSACLWLLVGSFAGGRLLFAAVVGGSGTVFLGGVVGGVLALGGFAWFRRVRLAPLLDSVALGLPFGHALGRLGCFAAGCCFGKPWDSVLAVRFPRGSIAFAALGGSPGLFPTQLLEALLDLGLGGLLLVLRRRKRFHGQQSLRWILGYALLRFVVEIFRGDDRERGLLLRLSWPRLAGPLHLSPAAPLFLSTSQLLALLFALAAVSFGVWFSAVRRD